MFRMITIAGAALAAMAALATPSDARARQGGVHRGDVHATGVHTRILRPWDLRLQRRYSGLYQSGYTPGFTPPWVYSNANDPYGYSADPVVSVCYHVARVTTRKGKRLRRVRVCD